MFILHVIPISNSFTKGSLSYLSKNKLHEGDLVSIPLRKQTTIGIVISIEPLSNYKQELKQHRFQLKHIHRTLSEKLFSPIYLETIFELSRFWCLHPGKLINISFPKKVREQKEFILHTVMDVVPKEQVAEQSYLMESFEGRIETFIREYREARENGGFLYIISPSKIHSARLEKALRERGVPSQEILKVTTAPSLDKLSSLQERLNHESGILITSPLYLDLFARTTTTLVIEKDSSSQYERMVEPIIDMRIFVEHYAKKCVRKIIYADVVLREERLREHESFDSNFFKEKEIIIYNQKKEGTLKKSDAERIEALEHKKKYKLIHQSLLREIHARYTEGKKIFCFVARKSLAPNLVCERCGALLRSPKTKSPYRLSQLSEKGEKKFLFTTKEGEKIEAFDTCPSCSGRLASFGIGTQTIATALAEEGIDATIIDAEHTPKESDRKKALSSQVIIGTSMAIPYLKEIDDFFVLSMDSLFSKLSYRADFEALYIISELLEYTQKIQIQTRNVLEEKLPLLKEKNFKAHLKRQKQLAQKYKLPPESISIEIVHRGKIDELKNWEGYYTKEAAAFLSHTRFRSSQGKLSLHVFLEIDAREWNPQYQKSELRELLPNQDHQIHIHINPKEL